MREPAPQNDFRMVNIRLWPGGVKGIGRGIAINSVQIVDIRSHDRAKMQTMGINVQTYLLTGSITNDASKIYACSFKHKFAYPGTG
ncbi:hypothetical protein CWM54_04565 [Klebsiella sp. D-Nf1]|nr:hypothetical protein CWM62_03765 [Klebsiella sp. C-Nf10]PJX54807.1 hypothetical protein CWM54_04565 [Klebsiella sp. D-Nf1]